MMTVTRVTTEQNLVTPKMSMVKMAAWKIHRAADAEWRAIRDTHDDHAFHVQMKQACRLPKTKPPHH